jgi:hypothetical protein
MAAKVTIPSLEFSGMYYPQILDALLRYKRENVPELTDESEFEPLIQFIRMQALVGHLTNTLIDLVANESTLPTAKLADTVRDMLRLIDYKLKSATPAKAEVLFKLARILTASTLIIPDRAQVAISKQSTLPVIFFEAMEALTVARTDQLTRCYVSRAGVLTELTTVANGVGTAQLWLVAPSLADAVYWGHSGVMWNELDVALSVLGADITGVWEYFDGNTLQEQPSLVTDNGPNLTFQLAYLGATSRAGLVVRVQVNETGAFEDCVVTFSGGVNRITTVGLLGQTLPSTDIEAYTVGAMWRELDNLVDATSLLTSSGKVSFNLPQSLTKEWNKTTLPLAGGVVTDSCFWLRFRVISTGGGYTSPTIGRQRIDTKDQYAIHEVTQGQTIVEVVGGSDGTANQSFETTNDFFIGGSAAISIGGVEWVEVESFTNSGPNDKHFTIELGTNDRATVVFGDGVTGGIPPVGVNNITATYRVGANDNGNVGSGTIEVDKTGLTYIGSVINPRSAFGWKASEAADATELERVKITGPATLRIKGVAVGPTDVETLASEYVDDTGASPFSRAKAFEEGFGPKTVELVVVASGGGLASAEALAALDTYFNGDPFSNPAKPKRIVANQEVTSINYTQRQINITATVKGRVQAAAIETALARLLQPEALGDDGVTFEWAFGDTIPVSRLIHEIFQVDPDIEDVDITVPAVDLTLTNRELPVAGTFAITVVE